MSFVVALIQYKRALGGPQEDSDRQKDRLDRSVVHTPAPTSMATSYFPWWKSARSVSLTPCLRAISLDEFTDMSYIHLPGSSTDPSRPTTPQFSNALSGSWGIEDSLRPSSLRWVSTVIDGSIDAQNVQPLAPLSLQGKLKKPAQCHLVESAISRNSGSDLSTRTESVVCALDVECRRTVDAIGRLKGTIRRTIRYNR